ncbi:hypothetical protein VTK26DRAFT_2341 [Humicola hyalothermophila]
MAPSSGSHDSAKSSSFETPFTPTLARASTAPIALGSHRADPSHLAPEDAYNPVSPPRRPAAFDIRRDASGTDLRLRRTRPNDERNPSRPRRRKRFQKLLWVKQSYPDNYTDQATFLENLQRNPRVRPYDFWPLVADTTVIVQHVCSVIIFVVCFVGIFQERVNPMSVVGWGSFATFLGWLLWDWWVSQETRGSTGDEDTKVRSIRSGSAVPPVLRSDPSGLDQPLLNISTPEFPGTPNQPSPAGSTSDLLQPPSLQPGHSTDKKDNNTSTSSLLIPRGPHSRPASSINSPTSNSPTGLEPPTNIPPPARRGRAYTRANTIKSALLIFFTLLGLSPILKSLTRSTSSDSIWAMSFWLLAINVFFFDYSGGLSRSAPGLGPGPGPSPHGGGGGGPRKKMMPVASLSTNAALMASTVLASRLPSTGQVFSLTLFSIEVFGLFPVFRQYVRRRSWRYHVALTALLVAGAGAGVGMILGDDNVAVDVHVYAAGASASSLPSLSSSSSWWPTCRRGLVGMAVACLISAVAMGGCSWWLIGLQKYKNEIYGPWDPARPIIISRRYYWDDE